MRAYARLIRRYASLTTSEAKTILSSSERSGIPDSFNTNALQNDFEPAVFELEPEIKRAKVALMKAGERVATIDLDCRQQSFTRYMNNRGAWARRTALNLELPVHCCIKLGETMQIADNENSELQQFMDAVSAVESSFDFIVIDTPGTDSYLMRLAHSMADTLVTPINDSFLDFDVLGTVDPATYAVTGESH